MGAFILGTERGGALIPQRIVNERPIKPSIKSFFWDPETRTTAHRFSVRTEILRNRPFSPAQNTGGRNQTSDSEMGIQFYGLRSAGQIAKQTVNERPFEPCVKLPFSNLINL